MSNESMPVKEIDLRQFAPHPKNANKHGPEQIDELKKSHAKFGQPKPLVVWRGFILTGHANAQAFVQDEQFIVNAIDVSSWDEKKAVQWMNADNLTGHMGEYDADIFRGNLDWLGNDTDIPGLTNQVIEDLFGPDDVGAFDGLFGGGSDFEGDGAGDSEDREAPEPQIDRASELAEELGVKVGQRWRLGRHIVACIDSTDEVEVKELVGERAVDMFFTDPPYSVSYADKNKSLNRVDKGNRIQTPITNDHLTTEEISKQVWLPVFNNMFSVSKKGCVFYMTMPQGGDQMMIMMMITNAGWLLKHELIWVKNNMVLGRADYHYQHEPIAYGWKPGAGHYFIDDRTQKSVWNFDKPQRSEYHPTTKPVPLIEKAINNSSRQGELIADLFLGSGSTLLACEKTSRDFIGTEIEPNYVAVTIHRWQELTGLKATLEG